MKKFPTYQYHLLAIGGSNAISNGMAKQFQVANTITSRSNLVLPGEFSLMIPGLILGPNSTWTSLTSVTLPFFGESFVDD